MSATIRRDSWLRSLSTTAILMFLTSSVATSGSTSITITGMTKIIFGMIGLRFSRLISLRSRARSIRVFIWSQVFDLNFPIAMARSAAVMPVNMANSPMT